MHPLQLNKGDSVFLLKEPTKGKFAIQYTGPYKVLDILPNHNVKIQYGNSTRMVHVHKLKRLHIDPG